MSTNKALVKSFVEEVFNKHDLSSIEKYLTEQGSKGFKQLSEFFTAFPERVTFFSFVCHFNSNNSLIRFLKSSFAIGIVMKQILS